jgi:polysaccharide biosynthesis/export protein
VNRSVVLSAIPALIITALGLVATPAQSQTAAPEYVLGAGDILHITVFNNPELTTDARVSESGSITFPFVGNLPVVGLSISQAQNALAQKLGDAHIVSQPQVNILPTLLVGSQVTVMGHVNRPGRYPLQTTNTHLSDAVALAGGIDAIGADQLVLIQHSEGKEVRTVIDVPDLLERGSGRDQLVQGGDTIYVPREPVFYVYGEVEHSGSFRLERNMILMQGLALGGFVNGRGSKSRTQVYRQDSAGKLREIDLGLTDPLMPNDVIYVRTRIL